MLYVDLENNACLCAGLHVAGHKLNIEVTMSMSGLTNIRTRVECQIDYVYLL